LGGLLRPAPGDTRWRVAFLAGLLLAPLVWRLVAAPITPRIAAGPLLLVAAGLLVGWGTRHGGGCTSGHGVCGIARLSPRSLLATCIFMAAAVLTVAVTRHAIGG